MSSARQERARVEDGAPVRATDVLRLGGHRGVRLDAAAARTVAQRVGALGRTLRASRPRRLGVLCVVGVGVAELASLLPHDLADHHLFVSFFP